MPKKRVKGSLFTEIVLWCFFLVPGLIYTIWRQSTKAWICRKCGSTEVIPVDSPVGQKLKAEGNV